MIRYFVYCSLIAMVFVFTAAGGDVDVVQGRIAFVIASVMWLFCMAIGGVRRLLRREA